MARPSMPCAPTRPRRRSGPSTTCSRLAPSVARRRRGSRRPARRILEPGLSRAAAPRSLPAGAGACHGRPCAARRHGADLPAGRLVRPQSLLTGLCQGRCQRAGSASPGRDAPADVPKIADRLADRSRCLPRHPGRLSIGAIACRSMSSRTAPAPSRSSTRSGNLVDLERIGYLALYSPPCVMPSPPAPTCAATSCGPCSTTSNGARAMPIASAWSMSTMRRSGESRRPRRAGTRDDPGRGGQVAR